MKKPPIRRRITTAAISHLARGCERKNPTERVSATVRRSLPERRLSSFSGVSTSVRTGSFTSSSTSYCEILIGSATLFSSQECSRPLLRLAQGAHQRQLGYVILIQGLNVVLIRASNCFLRLHYFKASGNAGFIAVLRFLQLLGRKIDLLVGHGHLIVRGLHVQQRRADFIFHAAAQVFQLQPFLPQQRPCLVDVRFYFSALKDWYAYAGGNGVCVLCASGRWPDEASLSVHFHGWQRFAFGGLHGKFSRAHTRFRCPKFRPHLVCVGQRFFQV